VRLGHLLYYPLGLAGLRRNDVLVASFPKSGNTWVRFFFCNLIEVLAGREQLVDFTTLDRVMPELGVSNLLARWPHAPVPRVVKTHKRRWPVFAGRRAILLTRDPRDVMVSFFYFEGGKQRPRTEGTFSDFLRHERFGLRAWFEHTSSWLRSKPAWVTYEGLKEDDVAEFARLLDYLKLEVEPESIREAARRSSFESVRGLENKKKHKPDKYKQDFQFTRSGKRGGWKELFSSADLDYFAELKEEFSISTY
jgi:hypothetical protein